MMIMIMNPISLKNINVMQKWISKGHAFLKKGHVFNYLFSIVDQQSWTQKDKDVNNCSVICNREMETSMQSWQGKIEDDEDKHYKLKLSSI